MSTTPLSGTSDRGATAPRAASETIRRRMSRTKRRDTRPELAIRSGLHRGGLRFFVDRAILGRRRRADIVFPSERVAVFVDGCFWHSCPQHGTVPKNNREWWLRKLADNRSRDADTDRQLSERGWTVVRIWEHEDAAEAVGRVRSTVLRIRRGPKSRHTP